MPAMTPDDAANSLSVGMGMLARSLDQITQGLREATRSLARLIVVGSILTFLGVVGLGAIVWQVWGLGRATQDLHQQTRVMVQTNQALLTELLGRTPRQP
jgi:hypothetical protein